MPTNSSRTSRFLDFLLRVIAERSSHGKGFALAGSFRVENSLQTAAFHCGVSLALAVLRFLLQEDLGGLREDTGGRRVVGVIGASKVVVKACSFVFYLEALCETSRRSGFGLHDVGVAVNEVINDVDLSSDGGCTVVLADGLCACRDNRGHGSETLQHSVGALSGVNAASAEL